MHLRQLKTGGLSLLLTTGIKCWHSRLLMQTVSTHVTISSRLHAEAFAWSSFIVLVPSRCISTTDLVLKHQHIHTSLHCLPLLALVMLMIQASHCWPQIYVNIQVVSHCFIWCLCSSHSPQPHSQRRVGRCAQWQLRWSWPQSHQCPWGVQEPCLQERSTCKHEGCASLQQFAWGHV